MNRTRLDRRRKPAISPLGHERYLLLSDVNFHYLCLFSWQAAYQHENAGVFPAKCVRTAGKAMVVDKINQKALALLYLASKPPRNAANSSGVPTEFVTEPTRQIWTFGLNFIA